MQSASVSHLVRAVIKMRNLLKLILAEKCHALGNEVKLYKPIAPDFLLQAPNVVLLGGVRDKRDDIWQQNSPTCAIPLNHHGE